MSNSASGGIVLRKLRNGSTSALTLSVDKIYSQLVTINADGSASVVPDWSQAGNQPTITPTLLGNNGNTLTDHSWFYNGDPVASYPTKFKVNSNGSLTIIGNLASASNQYTDVITYKGMIFDANSVAQGNIEKSIDIPISKAAASGYTVLLACADGTTLSSSLTSIAAKAVVYLGTTDVTSNVTIKWFKGINSTTVIGTGATLTIDRTMVDGAQLFIARAYSGSTEVDAQGITIYDTADEYQIQMAVTIGTDTTNVSDGITVPASIASSTVTATATRNGSSSGVTASGWSISKYHADTDKLIGEVKDAQGVAINDYTQDTDTADSYNTAAANTIIVYDKDYISYYGTKKRDVEVGVTASATIN